jgi:hypothetical protein
VKGRICPHSSVHPIGPSDCIQRLSFFLCCEQFTPQLSQYRGNPPFIYKPTIGRYARSQVQRAPSVGLRRVRKAATPWSWRRWWRVRRWVRRCAATGPCVHWGWRRLPWCWRWLPWWSTTFGPRIHWGEQRIPSAAAAAGVAAVRVVCAEHRVSSAASPA